jgi:hypothetical protein
MLRTERPRLEPPSSHGSRSQVSARELLLALAPPPRTPTYSLAGWPSWLTPTYRSGAHRSPSRSEEER